MTTAASGERTAGAPALEELVAAFLRLRQPVAPAAAELALAVYGRLASGRPATVPELAAHSGQPVADVERQLSEWTGVLWDAGAVVGFWGLGLEETPHRLELRGVTVHTWCAWDPLFLVPLLECPATLVTTCPATGATVRLHLRPDGPPDPEPDAATLSFVAPCGEGADVRTAFCRYVHLFADAPSAAAWAASWPDGFTLTLAEASRLATMVNEARYPCLRQRGRAREDAR